MNNTKRIFLSLDNKTINQLEEIATENKLTKSVVVKLLIKTFLSTDEPIEENLISLLANNEANARVLNVLKQYKG